MAQETQSTTEAGSGDARWSVQETTTLKARTVEVLRDAILTEHFKPGHKLVERTLAEETGVSRTSVREALSQLEAEGLVIRSGRGMCVTRVTISEANQIYEMRAVIESAMARMFAMRASDADIQKLEAAVASAKAINRPDSALPHARALDEITDLMLTGAGNDIARQMATVLRARITYLRTMTARRASSERRAETMAMLQAIVDAFRARDASLAEGLMLAYVERSAAFAQQVLRTHESEAVESNTFE